MCTLTYMVKKQWMFFKINRIDILPNNYYATCKSQFWDTSMPMEVKGLIEKRESRILDAKGETLQFGTSAGHCQYALH